MVSVGAQGELLSESERTRVVRLHPPGEPSVIRKEPLGPGREKRVSHEVGILRRLAGVAHVVQLVRHQPDPASILLEDFGGVPLARASMPLHGTSMVDLMLRLAAAVAAVHQHKVVHGDISPANILIADDRDSPCLIDFALATTFADLRPEFTHHKEIVGTLPYLAPEQTGRTGRTVDHRADLYGLGATMYELATGSPPFGTGDPLRLIHDHLARPVVPPATINPDVSMALSEIIVHLLEKEPDNRYQTAEGVIRDLERVRGGAQRLRIGADDMPARLTQPSRLVGREHEIEVLRSAFEGVLAGEFRGVVVRGGSGVGKSALVDELRPIVTAGDGWFASGKFDRYRRDHEHDGVGQAFRALGRLLLAEPDDELAEIRQRLLDGLGPNAGTAAAVLPEFATLLNVSPDPGDPLTAQARARRSGVELLRAVASRKRPVVYAIDDIQWAGATPLGMLDELLSGDEVVEGLLVVVVYREGEVREADLLARLLARWQEQPGRREHLRITNLNQDFLGALVGEMMHATPESVGDLAEAVFGVTAGNPYETVQLLNGLRREGVLQATGSGWSWDQATLEQRLARENVAGLTQVRLDGVPAATRQTLEAMACLGGEVPLDAIEVATGMSASAVQQRLAPALEDGLLVMVAERRGVRFQHDRLRDAVLAGIAPQQLSRLRLRMARRLAARHNLSAAAADQYLHVVDALHDPEERHRAAALLRQAADESMWIGESLPAEKMLAAAVPLADDPTTLVGLHTARHAALFRLGRLAEADEVYQTIVSLSTSPYDRVEAARVQISSLTNRDPAAAMELGLDLLRQLGWDMPSRDVVETEIDRGLDWSTRWIDETSETDDLRRTDIDDPAILAAGALISAMLPACFFRDQVAMAWLAVAAARLWADRGPARTLVGAVGHLPWVLVRRRQAYRAGYQLTRRLLDVGRERGYEPDLGQVHFLYALGLCHWFQPVEEEIIEARSAREVLIRGGDLMNACYTTSMAYLDVSRTLGSFASEADSTVAFAERVGNEHAASIYRPYGWLAAALRDGPPSIADERLAGPMAAEPVVAANTHVARALAATILDDAESLAEHSHGAMSLLAFLDVTYGDWQAHLVRAIALADRIRSAPGSAADLAELDTVVDWAAKRAADMPRNFQHMLRLIEAERAWAVRDFRTAMRAFDSALRGAGHRPWHRAYIAERLAKFMLAHGLDHTGWFLLVEAREAYRVWGARAKVDQLDQAYPSLDIPSDSAAGHATRRASITAGAIDVAGILTASRALSSETSIGALRAKVVEVVSAMTGATGVDLLLWSAERRRWLAATDGNGLDERDRTPHSVTRYVERTREPLIVGDATRDDRFARDPYFVDLDTCAVLAAPVVSRGELRAILLLVNHLIRDAFPAERLEGVMLIAGQLAVSLDNALMYASLERKVEERTEELALANERLEQLTVTDPLTGLANRRRFVDSLRNEWGRVGRTNAPLSLGIVDIDHFKQYNDLHGHPAGDRCLQHIATRLDRTVRDTDLVARYGGEEFAIIMPDTDATGARELAERVRTAIIDLGERLTDTETLTVSIGVATIIDADQHNTDHLVERADAALYQAKRAGRNRVRSADADRP